MVSTFQKILKDKVVLAVLIINVEVNIENDIMRQ